MEERRKQERRQTADYFKQKGKSESNDFDVIDRNIDQSIGRLVDIHSDGMKIQSLEPVEKGTIYNFGIELPEEVKGSDQLTVEARSLWCQKSIDQDYYYAGFEFLTKFQHHAEIIELLFHSCAPSGDIGQPV